MPYLLLEAPFSAQIFNAEDGVKSIYYGKFVAK
jgi:hypothetical protein